MSATHRPRSSRRNFLRTSLGVLPAVFGLRSSLLAQDPLRENAGPSFGNYRALVCVRLDGGNDSLNMLVPFGDDPDRGYKPYARARRGLAVERHAMNLPDLRQTSLGTGSDNPYHVNGSRAAA